MAGKSDYLENGLLLLIFNGTPLGTLADNDAAAPTTNFYVSLHTADPTDTGNPTASEVTTGQYVEYARVAVVRTSGGWTVTGDTVVPAAPIVFATTGSGGSGCTVTHFAVGAAASGATPVFLYSGTVVPSMVIPAATAGTIPTLTVQSTITEA